MKPPKNPKRVKSELPIGPADIWQLILSEIPSHQRSFRAVNRRARRLFSVEKLPTISDDLADLAFHGHLKLIQRYSSAYFSCSELHIRQAVRGNQLETLQWLYEVGGRLPNDLIGIALEKNSHEILIWLHQHITSVTANDAYNLAKSGNLEMVKLFFSSKHYSILSWYLGAVRYKQIAVLDWLYLQHPDLNQINFLGEAIVDGHLEVVKWLYQHGCVGDRYTIAYAITQNRFDILKWLREQDCPWYERPCLIAAENGHLEILQWLRDPEQQCPPWNQNDCYRAAFKYPAVQAWIASQ